MTNAAPRVALDTNVVLSALLFSNGRLAWLRHAWQRGQLCPLVCKPTVSELLRVLAYPKFKLTAQQKQDLLADFLPYAQVVQLPEAWPEPPACRDEKDQVFLVLAHLGQAQALTDHWRCRFAGLAQGFSRWLDRHAAGVGNAARHGGLKEITH